MRNERLQHAIDKAFRNRYLCMQDIILIMELARNLFDLDHVFVITNKEYKYQLNHVIICEQQGINVSHKNSIMLSKAQYDDMVLSFQEQPIQEKALSDAIEYDYLGDILSCAIMQGYNYYGNVVFGSKNQKLWSEDEKETLMEISHLLLIFFGFNYLKEGLNHYEQKKLRFQNDTVSSVFFLNMNNGMCNSVKLAPHLQKEVAEWEAYSVLLDNYTEKFVDSLYRKQIREQFDLEALKQTLSIKNPIEMLEFPRIVDGDVVWIRLAVELMDSNPEGTPHRAYMVFYNITLEVQNNAYLSGFSHMSKDMYSLIAAIDLVSENYAVYVDNRDESAKTQDIHFCGGYRDLIEKMATLFIDKEYASQFEKLFSLEHLRIHFRDSKEKLLFEFPFLMKGNTYWVKLEAVKTQDYDTNGNRILLYYSDITAQKNQELQLHKTSLNLKKEHERVLEAELQALTDPLTGVYNRAGFEKTLDLYRNENVPIGFVIIDIDYFKVLNDTYGHAFGDYILSLVSKWLLTTFRNEDKVFRLGGDEFAILLHGCGEDAWNSLIIKFSNLHYYLKDKVDKDILITLSAGFCRSEKGYEDYLFSVADEALYYTKNTGRVGITQFSKKHKLVYSWHDKAFYNDKMQAMNTTVIGNGRVEYNEEMISPRLFIDEATHVMLEIPGVLSPEECFEFWKKRIVTRHNELYYEMKEKLIKKGRAECIYHWNHPSQGEITLRTVARYRSSGAVKEFYVYTQVLRDADFVFSQDDDHFLMEAINRIYFCTYYFNLQTKDYFILKGHDEEPDKKERHTNIDIAFQKYVQEFVCLEDQKKVAEFADLNTLAERLKNHVYVECEYYSNKIGLCRTRILPVKWDEEGNLTHAVSMSSCIDTSKKTKDR